MSAFRATRERGLRATVEPVVSWLVRRRIHPNLISTAGFVLTCSSGYFFHQHHVRTAGLLILLGGVFDIFDGSVARRTGLASPFGAFYDSALDRLSEILLSPWPMREENKLREVWKAEHTTAQAKAKALFDAVEATGIEPYEVPDRFPPD